MRWMSACGHLSAAWSQTNDGALLRLPPVLQIEEAPEQAVQQGVSTAAPVGQTIDVPSRDESSKRLAGRARPDPSPRDLRLDIA